ncbi:hypothetical protein [Ktedonosporobacter rubrisoli]|uniref:hypothetical protein n=1 Tax=Ktedonosporobacter rubrisoli TaxID=2509675 RepID=UPI001A9266B9|nr:hypothetical protein [Ktedonosporobacter rubrisoli]
MEPEDFLEPEVAVTAAVVAAVFSPRIRKVIRRGLVYGTAGVLIAGDAVTSFAKNIGEGAKQATTSVAQATQEGVQQAKEADKETASEEPVGTASTTRKNQKASRSNAGEQEQGEKKK